MSLQQTSPTTRERFRALTRSETYLHGPALVQARITWVVLTLLALGLYVASLPSYSAALQRGNALPGGPQLAPGDLHTLQRLGLSLDSYAWFVIGVNTIILLGYVLVGVVLFWRASSDRVAWLASLSLVLFPIYLSVPIGVPPPTWTVPTESLELLGIVCLGLFFYVFPSGRFVPRWTRWLLPVWIAYHTYDAFFPGTPLSKSWPNAVFGLCLFVSQVAAQIYRYRRVSTPVERQQTKWVIFGIALAFGSYATSFLLFIVLPRSFFSLSPLAHVLGLLAGTLMTLLFPLALGMAILRYRLWEIDLLINRALVYGMLTASVVGCYILVVGYLGALFRTGSNLAIALLATGLVAVLFQPLRGWLQRGVNRLMYGQRDEPYAVIARLGRRLESTLAPEAMLSAIVETVAQALKLPYAALTLKQGEDFKTASTYGLPVQGTLTLPLPYQSEPIGQLVLGPRQRGEGFNPADRRLLEDLARQVGIAAHAVRLTSDLQRSRERLVTAREEERRRLRRDLHDSLGPALGSLTLQLDTVRTLLTQDLSAADTLLVDLKGQVQTALTDIRRLVYALRPPTLDELGLLSALCEQMAHYRHPGLSITLNEPEHLPPLPAAVEVALFRIAQEALTNVVRHAQASSCVVSLHIEHDACLEIGDDGQGLPTDFCAGVGMTSMRERAAELGGTCHFEAGTAGGTRIVVRLPLPKEDHDASRSTRADC
jgi:signal transduction histidine kinase